MFTIAKVFPFEASHALTHLPPDHQCARLHGHSYVVTLIVAAPTLDANGFVVDFGELAPFADYIKHNFDHRDLNVVRGAPQETTSERLALHFYNVAFDMFGALVAGVRVSETLKTYAEYRP